MQAIKEVAGQALPPGYGYEFSGMSREEQKSGSQTVYIFILSLLFVYFLLSALYESYLLPLVVMLSLPVGLSGIFVLRLPPGLVTPRQPLRLTVRMLTGERDVPGKPAESPDTTRPRVRRPHQRPRPARFRERRRRMIPAARPTRPIPFCRRSS